MSGSEHELPPDPTERLDPAVIWTWVAGGVGATVATALMAGVLIPVLREVDGVPGWVEPAVVTAAVLVGVLSIGVLPLLRHRTWRYAVRPAEIDLQRGVVVRRRTIIPMARVQHVDTEAGLVARMLDITTLSVHTAAGEHEIPGLRESRAYALRTQIAREAHEPEDV